MILILAFLSVNSLGAVMPTKPVDTSTEVYLGGRPLGIEPERRAAGGTLRRIERAATIEGRPQHHARHQAQLRGRQPRRQRLRERARRAAHQVLAQGQPVELSNREYDLLHALMLNAGRVLSREQLEQRLYEWGSEINSNAVEVHVYHLRRKLGAGLIETVRGVGYRIPRVQA